MLKGIFAVGVCLCVPFLSLFEEERAVSEFSTAGFFAVEGAPRRVQSMNVAFRFHHGDVADAGVRDFNDRDWSPVSVPHGIEYVPSITKPGEIKITVSLLHSGTQKSAPATLEFSAVPSARPHCFDSETASCLDSSKVLK